MTRHRFDVVSFFFGTIFTVTGITFGFGENPWSLVLDFSTASRWIGPATLLIIGLALLRPVFRTQATVVADHELPETPTEALPPLD